MPFAIRHPAGKAKGRTSQLLRLARTTSARRCCRRSACDEPRGMNGADLSPLLRRQAPRTKRSYRTAAYNTT